MATEIQPIQVYLALAIVGLFSGIGTAFGQYIFNEIIKPRIDKHVKKIKKIKTKDIILPKVEP